MLMHAYSDIAAQQSLLTLLHIYFPGPYVWISMVPSCLELAECCFPAQMQTENSLQLLCQYNSYLVFAESGV